MAALRALLPLLAVFACCPADAASRAAVSPAAGPRLGVIELEGLNVSRTFELSTAGLTDALGLLQKRCDKREDAGAAAAAPTY